MDLDLQRKLTDFVKIDDFFLYYYSVDDEITATYSKRNGKTDQKAYETVYYTISSRDGLVFYNDGVNKYHYSGFINTSTYEKIYYQYWKLPNNKKSIVFVHGNAEHSSNHPKFIWHLLRSGYNVYTYDQVGYGNSSGIRGTLLDFGTAVKDLQLLVEFFSRLMPRKNRKRGHKRIVNKEKHDCYLMGFSMGGLIVYLWSLEHQNHSVIRKVVLMAPWFAVHPRIFNPFIRFLKSFIYRGPYVLMRERIQRFILTKDSAFYCLINKYLSDNTAYLKRRFKDTRIHRLISYHWLLSIDRYQRMAKKKHTSQYGYAFFIAKKDYVVNNNSSIKVFDSLSANKQLYIIDNAYHDFLDYEDYRWDAFARNLNKYLTNNANCDIV